MSSCISYYPDFQKQAMRRISTFVNFRLEITLGPLDLPEIKELISCVLNSDGSAIDEQLCTDVYQRNGGLPVYTIELLETAKRKNTIFHSDDGKIRLVRDEQVSEVSTPSLCLPCFNACCLIFSTSFLFHLLIGRKKKQRTSRVAVTSVRCT